MGRLTFSPYKEEIAVAQRIELPPSKRQMRVQISPASFAYLKSRSLMDKISDFESADIGSTPIETILVCLNKLN